MQMISDIYVDANDLFLSHYLEGPNNLGAWLAEGYLVE